MPDGVGDSVRDCWTNPNPNFAKARTKKMCATRPSIEGGSQTEGSFVQATLLLTLALALTLTLTLTPALTLTRSSP